MDKEEIKIESEAILFARTHKKSIIKKATDVSIFLPDTNPVSVFMAGSPGAGKTELSKHLIEAKQVNIPFSVRRFHHCRCYSRCCFVAKAKFHIRRHIQQLKQSQREYTAFDQKGTDC